MPYSNENIMLDNAQAALFFHTIFREAENAWAFIHEKDYEPGTYYDPANRQTVTKTYIYDANDVTIEYKAWATSHLLLTGTIRVGFKIDSYRIDKSIANIYLIDFSIDGHDVMGEPAIQRISDNNYSFDIDCTIHEQGVNKPVLITGKIENGQYERIEGGETLLLQDDDVWAYSGTMTGMLHNDPKLVYTNTKFPYTDENGEEQDGTILFTMNPACKTAQKGASLITIKERPDIAFAYFCTVVDFFSVEHIH